ncbi:gliding motility protein GldC [Luteibaculum oceani]|uniref:Gliding motility protein GldC n=1 Tax=Luteibaculum oceani TaxID=1294296 RepID=A0A5C6V5H6_9FLAO|nr:gliding motility protein GldC [Luteibaculum oceani]TXC78885.1 gliding motility protein GldC [Luteibaculum oceani]
MGKDSKIELTVSTDENHVPENINWKAELEGIDSDAKALLLSVWDKKEENMLRIDLWTKEMTIDEMKHFFYRSLLSMADTFERATNEAQICNDMRDFAHYFGVQTKIVSPSGNDEGAE